MVSLMPVVSLRTRNQSQRGWRSIEAVIPDGERSEPIGDPCIPIVRTQASVPLKNGSRLSPGSRPGSAGMTMCALRPLLLGILLVHLLQECRCRDIPFLLELDQLPGPVPVFELEKKWNIPASAF